MTKRLLIFILAVLLVLSFVIFIRCGGAPSAPSGNGNGDGDNGGEEVARWSNSKWGQCNWTP